MPLVPIILVSLAVGGGALGVGLGIDKAGQGANEAGNGALKTAGAVAIALSAFAAYSALRK